MKKKLERIIPIYIILPLSMAIVVNYIVYFCTIPITNQFYHYNIYSKLDEMVPFIPFFIIIYILAYIQWGLGYYIIARDSENVCYRYIAADIVAKIICLICFFVIPTTIVRPEVSGGGIINYLTNFIYNLDSPVNLFPSIHCLESWMVFRGGIECKKMPKWYNWVNFVFTILVCLSTIFVKQHVVIDIFGGILVTEFSIFVSKRFNLGKYIKKANSFVLKDDDNNGKKVKKTF